MVSLPLFYASGSGFSEGGGGYNPFRDGSDDGDDGNDGDGGDDGTYDALVVRECCRRIACLFRFFVLTLFCFVLCVAPPTPAQEAPDPRPKTAKPTPPPRRLPPLPNAVSDGDANGDEEASDDGDDDDDDDVDFEGADDTIFGSSSTSSSEPDFDIAPDRSFGDGFVRAFACVCVCVCVICLFLCVRLACVSRLYRGR